MEDGTHASQGDADPTSGTFADFGPAARSNASMSRQRRSAGVGSAKIRPRVRR